MSKVDEPLFDLVPVNLRILIPHWVEIARTKEFYSYTNRTTGMKLEITKNEDDLDISFSTSHRDKVSKTMLDRLITKMSTKPNYEVATKGIHTHHKFIKVDNLPEFSTILKKFSAVNNCCI
ncbi:hypothetical protein Molly5_130 [Maribacter phage Molly_5]|uniref:Uncharacterized protein n=1 Tax=Maribacter phage Molly_1 TaxID=2745685 RepID=A0A8E4UY53_9CAUD|nr:hypothetical protein M1M29_gp129 [Maribacter phage Molly_1]QQO97621.1 hypothetical protein Molly2_129 [Maribacter phage Molly_2]QQO97821.1 hypothetical protein Molly3_129 [Maribacter phage Molly_3]QQO98023.1 hypothetical protein Molly4_130 [Maribacter phage Molly_4]QQO98223.1 hypothetical protein Molly5_130 [Maribacter phage Molly_5]QQO97421.1 hypothetical protein Molly1_129 [Maribacter phage Molly_1]